MDTLDLGLNCPFKAAVSRCISYGENFSTTFVQLTQQVSMVLCEAL